MMTCIFCSRECKSTKSLGNHQVRCNVNPDRIPQSAGNTGKVGVNRYTKAKRLGKLIVITDEFRKKQSLNSTGKQHSEETKKKISIKRIQFLEANPDKVPYLLNHSSKISYPEQYFIDCFLDIVDTGFQYHINRYKVDFSNIVEKLYLEIDGEQHYSDKKMVAHDIIRTNRLESLGWVGIRIRWAEFQKLSDIEKKEKVKDIIIKMKWK